MKLAVRIATGAGRFTLEERECDAISATRGPRDYIVNYSARDAVSGQWYAFTKKENAGAQIPTWKDFRERRGPYLLPVEGRSSGNTVVHIYRYSDIPSDTGSAYWTAEDENGKERGEGLLKTFRQMWGVRLHKGIHPDPLRRGHHINYIKDARNLLIYWTEVKSL